jgi:hypothetical protein
MIKLSDFILFIVATALVAVLVRTSLYAQWPGKELAVKEDSQFYPPPEKLAHNLVKYNKTIWCADDDYPFLIALSECCEWRLVSDPFNATFLWTVGKEDIYHGWTKLALGNGQMWNQLPTGGMMTDKSRLHKLLVNIEATEFQPETYILTDPEECVEFFSGPATNESIIWVTKEPLSAEGEGIIINPKISDLRKTWLKDPNATPDKLKCRTDISTDAILIQRYVLNPLLLNGKKMEIRSYWLVASIEPFVVLYYREGTVRLTTRDYKPEEWSDPLIHITNTRQQKKADPNYYQTEIERKWSLQQLADYVVEQKKLDVTPKDWLHELRITLTEIIGRVARGAYSQLLKNKGEKVWDGRFELFGMDVILDDDLRPWLTEIQDGPSLSLDPGTKSKVIKEMLEELTNVMLEVDNAHRFNNHRIPLLKSLGNWEYVHTNY